MASNARYKEFRSVKWTEEKFVEAVRSFPCRGRQLRSATSTFLTKGYGTPLVNTVCEILRAPKRFFGDVILLRRKYRAKFSKKHIYSFSSIFMLLNEYHVINRAESPLERERFSKIVNKPPRGLHGARLRAQPVAPRRIATRHNYCELGFIRDAAAANAIIVWRRTPRL